MTAILWSLVLAAILILLIVGILYKIWPFKRVLIYEHQKGLKYVLGRYVATLDAGRYWTLPNYISISAVDIRPEFISIPGQDVLSADGVTLKISLAAEFEIIDPHTAINKTANFRTALYLSLQMALREIVATEKIDDLLLNRSTIAAKLMQRTSTKAAEYGLKLKLADVKDMMFAGEMKKAFSQVVKAQKEGQAALERARGESAALRNLANAARLIDDNPNLLQLRALQGLADSQGNTLVLGLPNVGIPFTKNKSKTDLTKKEEQTEE
jgi:regulator of protease activity HflC (stomatin/prohibitin superfamily)